MLATVFTVMLDSSDEVGLVLAWNILQAFGHDIDANGDGKIDKDEIAAFKGIFGLQHQVRPCPPLRGGRTDRRVTVLCGAHLTDRPIDPSTGRCRSCRRVSSHRVAAVPRRRPRGRAQARARDNWRGGERLGAPTPHAQSATGTQRHQPCDGITTQEQEQEHN